jgi:hypothetical protein
MTAMQETPTTRYARSGEVHIAYQVVGEGPTDLVVVPGWVSNVECFWEEPRCAGFLRALAAFSRLIVFDKRGTGLSDRVGYLARGPVLAKTVGQRGGISAPRRPGRPRPPARAADPKRRNERCEPCSSSQPGRCGKASCSAVPTASATTRNPEPCSQGRWRSSGLSTARRSAAWRPRRLSHRPVRIV